MADAARPRLADHTTLRLGGPARAWVRVTTEDALIDAVRRADEAGEPVLVLGGGSNLVVADEGFDGTVVEVATSGVHADTPDDQGLLGGGAQPLTGGTTEPQGRVVAQELRHAGPPRGCRGRSHHRR